jgi:hypothetical protein
MGAPWIKTRFRAETWLVLAEADMGAATGTTGKDTTRSIKPIKLIKPGKMLNFMAEEVVVVERW